MEMPTFLDGRPNRNRNDQAQATRAMTTDVRRPTLQLGVDYHGRECAMLKPTSITPRALCAMIVADVARERSIDPVIINGRKRSRFAVHARVAVAKRLHKHGVKPIHIARLMKREVSTIRFYLNMLQKRPTPDEFSAGVSVVNDEERSQTAQGRASERLRHAAAL